MTTVNIGKLKNELNKFIKISEIDEEFRPALRVTKATNPDLDLSSLKFLEPIPGLDVTALIREDRDA